MNNKITFEQWKDIFVPNWRSITYSGFNDPNQGWYYQYSQYIKFHIDLCNSKPVDQMKCTNCADTGVILYPPGSEPFAKVCDNCVVSNEEQVSS